MESSSNKCFINSAVLRVSSVFLCVTVMPSYAENTRSYAEMKLYQLFPDKNL